MALIAPSMLIVTQFFLLIFFFNAGRLFSFNCSVLKTFLKKIQIHNLKAFRKL